ncbi:hypothetical protein [Algibacter aquimarinus]|uniref:Uncharacterized protein n=1 Tax=Algibacter aquimarinus TaxID=1136748 RepID=A0ABP9HR88_9FLAO
MIFRRKNREIELFDNPIINEFEKDVADSLGVSVYSENKSILGNILKKEIEQSKVEPKILLDYFINNSEQLKMFTIKAYSCGIKIDDGEEYPEGEEVPDSEKPKTIKTHGPGIGYGITHAIYFHFLYHDLTNELSEYLKIRRIPYSNRFYKRLTEYYNETIK